MAPITEGAKKEDESSFTDKIGTLVTAFSPAYWQALTVVSVLYFGRFDFTWVTLRAKAVRVFQCCMINQLCCAPAWFVAWYIVFNRNVTAAAMVNFQLREQIFVGC